MDIESKPMRIPMRWEESNGEQWWFATPLDWAASNGHVHVVRELLKLDANLMFELTSLRRIRRLEALWDEECSFTDAAKGRGLVTRELILQDCLQGSAVIDAGYGGWALYTAAAAGDMEIVRGLLKKKPQLALGEGEYGLTDMLYAAAKSNNLGIFQEILGFAKDNIELSTGNTDTESCRCMGMCITFEMMNKAVRAASTGGSLRILKEIFKQYRLPGGGQDYVDLVISCRDSRGATALHSAASRGHVEVLKELISISPDGIISKDHNGNTALHVAVYRGHWAVAKELLLSLPSLITTENNGGNTILHLAVAGFRSSGFRRLDKHIDLVRHLVSDKTLDMPSIVNCKNKEGRTAMHIAVITTKQVHEDLIKLLLLAPNLDINICDKNGMTAFDLVKMKLLSGLASESMLDLLATSGGKTGDSTGTFCNPSWEMFRPGYDLLGVAVTDTILCEQIEDEFGQSDIVEEHLDETLHSLTESKNCQQDSDIDSIHVDTKGNKRNINNDVAGNQTDGPINQTKQCHTRYFRFFHEKRGSKSPGRNMQDKENSSKGSTEEFAAFGQIKHTENYVLHKSIYERPYPLRQRYSTNSVADCREDDSSVFVGTTSQSPVAKEQWADHLSEKQSTHGYADQGVSPMFCSFPSPSTSFPLSPIMSPSLLATKVKGLLHTNGPMSLSRDPSVKEGAEDNAPYNNNSKPLRDTMNQYMCLRVSPETQKSKPPRVPLHKDPGRAWQLQGQ